MGNILIDVSANELHGPIYGVLDQYTVIVTGAGGAPPEGEVGPEPGDIYPIRVSGFTGDDADANGIYRKTIDGWVKGTSALDGFLMKGGGPLEGDEDHEWYLRRIVQNPPSGETIAWTDETGAIPPCVTWEGGGCPTLEKYGPYYDQVYTPVGVSNVVQDLYGGCFSYLSEDGLYDIVWYADTSDGLYHWAIVETGSDPETEYIHRGSNHIRPQEATWEDSVLVQNTLGGIIVRESDNPGCNQTYHGRKDSSSGYSTIYLSADGLYYLVYYMQAITKTTIVDGGDVHTEYFAGTWVLMWVAPDDPLDSYMLGGIGIGPELRYYPDMRWSSDAIYPWLADWDGTWEHLTPAGWYSYYPPWVPVETGIVVTRGTAVVSGWKTVGSRTCLQMTGAGYVNVRGKTELDLSGRGPLARVRIEGAGGLPGYSTANQVYSQITPSNWEWSEQATWNGTYYYGASCSDSPANFWILSRYWGDSLGNPSEALTHVWWGLFHYPTVTPAYDPAYYAPTTTNVWDAVWSPYYDVLGDYFGRTATPITVTRELPDDPATGMTGWTILADVWVDAIDGVERGIIMRRTAPVSGLISVTYGSPVYCMALDDDGKFYVALSGGDNGGVRVTAKQTAQIVTGAWQRYIAVWDGTSLILYLNGTAVATTACAMSGSSPTTGTFIGMMADCTQLPATWGNWKGAIGSVIMLDVAATARDIACNPLFAKAYGGAAAAPPS
jgi:hypothetical protein